MRCPYYPFRVPITAEIKLKNMHHRIDSQLMQIHDELPSDIVIRIHNSSELETTEKQLELMESPKLANYIIK